MAITFLDGLVTSGDLTVSGDSNLTGSVIVAGGNITLQGTGRIRGVDTVSAGTDAANKNYVDNAVAGIPVGDITGVTAGTGLSGGGNSGAVTLNLDLGELATGGTLIATDYLIAENGGVDNRQLISSIPLSIFNNNAGWTSNAGTVTGVNAGTGMTSGSIGATITLNVIGGTGITANANDIAIDSTVLTTTGSQTITGAKRFNSAILDSGGSSGSAGQVLASTGSGQVDWVAASSGGGIGGTTTATEIAFGSATASTLDSDPGLTYTSQDGLSVGDTTGSGNSIINMEKGDAGQARFFMKNAAGGVTTEKFSIKLDNSEDTYIQAGQTLTIATTDANKDIIIEPTRNVGIGDTTPSSKLSVDGGVQIGNDTATSATDLYNKVGTFRYRTVTGIKNLSYVDMVMQTGGTVGAASGTYAWVNIVSNSWT